MARTDLKKLEGAAAPLNALEKSLDKHGSLQKEVAKMHERVSKRLTANFRASLMNSYKASRLDTITGELIAAVNNIEVKASAKGIRLSLKSGKSKEFYARAGALNYGSVRGSGTKGKARAKFKKVLAKSGVKSAGGVSTTKAFNFFKLSTSQVRDLNAKYIEYFQQEVNKFLGAKGG